jgi:hypothetical protein
VNEVDAAILARVGDPVAGKDDTYFRDSVGVTVYDGWFKAPPPSGGVVPEYPLPYANFMSSFGDDDAPRLDGGYGQREEFFRFYIVGLTRQQTKWAIARIRARMARFRPVVPGMRLTPVRLSEAPLITRDDDALRPDGQGFLFYAVDSYTVRMSVSRTDPLA